MSRGSYPYPIYFPIGDGSDALFSMMCGLSGVGVVGFTGMLIILSKRRFHTRLHVVDNIIKVQYKKVNGPMDVRRVTHQNLEALRPLGYMIDAKPKEGLAYESWTTVAVVTKESLSIDQFRHACKFHKVSSVIDYEYEGAITSVDYQRRKQFAWGSCNVRGELA